MEIATKILTTATCFRQLSHDRRHSVRRLSREMADLILILNGEEAVLIYFTPFQCSAKEDQKSRFVDFVLETFELTTKYVNNGRNLFFLGITWHGKIKYVCLGGL
jgi:hypothetical protein